jgi:hypothetical protein
MDMILKNILRSMILACLVLLCSCKYKTQVINSVHRDGSVTRKVIIWNNSDYFEPQYFAVPIDSTWKIEITSEVDERDDTLWILTATKDFQSVEEINEAYKYDIGGNRGLNRRANFSKHFMWFTTVYRFSEKIERAFPVSCPISEYLNAGELDYYKLPENVRADLESGPDSTIYRMTKDSINAKLDYWEWTCELKQWTEIFYNLFGNHPDLEISKDEMKEKIPRMVEYILCADEPDSLFKFVLGEKFASTFREEIEHSISILEEMDNNYTSGRDYDLEIRMPGRIIASNGYAVTGPETGNGSVILWTVRGRYCLTQDFDMWIESRVNNYFIWGITGLFILFVIGGFIINHRKLKA